MALSDNKDGLSFYKFFVNNIDLFLEKDGSMYFEIPNSSITEIIIELVKNNQKIEFKFIDFNIIATSFRLVISLKIALSIKFSF